MLQALIIVVVLGAAGIGVMYLLTQTARTDAKGRPIRQKQTKSAGTRTKKPTSSYRRKPPAWMRVAPFVLLVGAVVSLVMGLTGFRFATEEKTGTAYLVMDVSKSMNQTDVTPSRLAAAQDAARTFLEQLPEDIRVSLTTFAGTADVAVVPTLDRERVLAGLDEVDIDQGTVLGDGLDLAIATYENDQFESGKGPAAIVLLTDGRDTGSSVPPESAAAQAQQLGLPVFTVLLSTSNESERGQQAAELLEQIAGMTAAESFTAQNATELSSIYETIGTQLSTDLAISEQGAMFVAVAAVLAIIAALIVWIGSRNQY